jgi:hypothetical protein
MGILSIIDKLLDIMLALAGQLVYSEKQSANPETIYNEEKQKIDSAIGSHDIAANDAVIDELLPPGH